MIRLVSLLILFSLPALAEEADPATLTHPGAQKCAVDLPPEGPSGGAWTDAEHYAWKQICLGEWADMSLVYGDDGLPCQPTEIEEQGDTVPLTRVLRPEFVQLILTREPWVSAPVKPQVNIECARIDGRLDLENQHVKATLGIDSSSLPGGANLDGARFDRTLSFEGSVFGAVLNASDLKVGGSVYFVGGAKFQEVWLIDATISGTLSAEGSEFDGSFIADRVQVGAGVFLRDGGSFLSVDLPGARIGDSLQLAGSNFAGTFDLTAATIGELVLFDIDDPIWGDDARLILRNTALGALSSRPRSWRSGENAWIEAELTGLTYDHLGGFREGEANTMLDASAEELVQWLDGVRPENMATRYDPGPYEQLAAVLDREGLSAKADAVRFAKFRHRDANPGEEISPWSEWVFRPASRWLLGYGVYPFTLLWWFAGLVVLGVFVSRFTRDERLSSLGEQIWYSLENALPLIELNTEHKDIIHGRSWVEGFFHAQKILGFLFATLLIGALSLLTE